ncbi:MAG: 50S ribosomal protein L24 [Actinobacteria bacterium]|nr:50S ribosomal protein L24 [Actinomycetota bacterium]
MRKDDRVRVISGKDSGKEGRVIRVFPTSDRVLVEGINYVKKHEKIRQSQRGSREGGIIETEAPVHLSNVQPVCPSCDKAVRVGFTLTDPADRRSKARVCRNCDATF